MSRPLVGLLSNFSSKGDPTIPTFVLFAGLRKTLACQAIFILDHVCGIL
jgi:hypothetical protein